MKLLQLVHSTIDQIIPHVVSSVLIGLAKAFNRADHNMIIEDLNKMKCLKLLLKIVF